MGEEEKKTEEKKQAASEGEEGNMVEKREEEKKPDKIQNQNQAENQKKEEKEASGSGGEDSKDAKEQDPAPPPPQEVVLKVYMHCEGCARKVRRCLKGFDGVEDVITDYKSHKVVVKGEKADPLQVLAIIQKKCHGQVELLSPITKPQTEEPQKLEEKEAPNLEEKKGEPQATAVVLKVHMHCEACSREIKKRILRMKGVESAEADLKSSEVLVKGVFEAHKLVDYVYRRTGKHAMIVKQDPPPEKKDEDQKVKDGKDEKKAEEGGDQEEEADQVESKGNAKENTENTAVEAAVEDNAKVVELKKNELSSLSYYYHPAFYPPKYPVDINSSSSTSSSTYQFYHPADAAYPPQLFSDENPNACSIM